ncbi:MAG TPA: cell division topological specificity factor MinE [Phototrophicaceae bacterium]|jgi:cell division topological specificity factor|nr:cell division topological specificity factor MinE [Phototrophicaceae bacterium]
MTSLIDRMLGRNKESSASQAKQRLQFVLVHDRIDLPPERLKAMKEEILAVISKYVALTGGDVDISLQQQDRNNNRLVAEIPFSRPLIDDPDEDEEPQQKYSGEE